MTADCEDTSAFSLNTLETALEMAKTLREQLERDDKNWRVLQIFALLTADYVETLMAFLIWKIRANERRAAKSP